MNKTKYPKIYRTSELVGAQSLSEIMAAKAKVGTQYADEISLIVLIALDAAHRKEGPPSLANFLAKHLIIARAIGSQMINKTFFEMCNKAYESLHRACLRDTALLDLTTGEYAAIKRAVKYYLSHLPNVERGLLDFCAELAHKALLDAQQAEQQPS